MRNLPTFLLLLFNFLVSSRGQHNFSATDGMVNTLGLADHMVCVTLNSAVSTKTSDVLDLAHGQFFVP